MICEISQRVFLSNMLNYKILIVGLTLIAIGLLGAPILAHLGRSDCAKSNLIQKNIDFEAADHQKDLGIQVLNPCEIKWAFFTFKEQKVWVNLLKI